MTDTRVFPGKKWLYRIRSGQWLFLGGRVEMALKLVGLSKGLSHFERIDGTDRLIKLRGPSLALESAVMAALSQGRVARDLLFHALHVLETSLCGFTKAEEQRGCL
jgi:hypothetical protein